MDGDNRRLLKDVKKLIISSNLEDVNKGLKYLKKVIKNDPNNVWAFIYYGVGASKSEKHKHEAVSAFVAASHICPDSVESWKGIRSCLEVKERSNDETDLLLKAYSNLLRIECDVVKWNRLYDEVKAYLTKVSSSCLASFLFSQLDDYTCKSFKHEVACRDLSYLGFENETLLDTNIDDIIYGFQCRANFESNFVDRPEFCKKVCSLLTKHKKFRALSNFLYHTILIYGSKLYMKVQIAQFVLDIAFDNLGNVEKLIPLVGPALKEVENVKTLPQLKLAVSIVNFFELDFTLMREHFENLIISGDIYATLFFIKILCKAKDYESVVFLSLRFAKAFANLSSFKLKSEFLFCLLEALSSSNDITFLEYGVKLGLKTLSVNGENPAILYRLCHSYIGLNDSKALFYLDKLLAHNKDDTTYLTSLMKREMPEFNTDSDKWVSSMLLSANYDLVNNDVNRALKTFTKIGVKDKCISEPFVALGVDALSKGSVERAASCFHRAFSLRPLDCDILKHYLDALFKLEDEQRALRVVDSIWSGPFAKWLCIGEKSLFASGFIHSAKGQHEKSVRCFKQLIKLNQNSSEFIEVISDEYLHLGRLGIAQNYVCRLVSNDPYDLHPLLLLSELHKLDVDYSSYYNQAVRSLNFSPRESRLCDRDIKFIFCFFCDFLQQHPKLEESSCSYLTKLCASSLRRIDLIFNKGSVERSHNNEYLIALYKFIEAHFIASLKIINQKDKQPEVIQLFIFCIKAIGRVFEIYGSNHISFWKLLGDILLKSSHLFCDINVFSWLTEDSINKLSRVSSIERIHLSIKCYVTTLEIALEKSAERVCECYYDISVALICLANHPATVDSEYRYFCLKSSLESCLKAFVHSDGLSDIRWIYSNLLGTIVSLLGVNDNMFKEHFSNCELKMTESLMLQNCAVHLAKTGLYSHAEEAFEQARLRVDMTYSSSWVGQLLMQLINKDSETKKMLQYNLSQIGYHPLYKWIIAYFLVNNRTGLSHHGGQFSLLNYSFPESECVQEMDPYRLTLLGHVHETIGNIDLARRLYFRVLRLARFVDDDTYHIFLENAIRLNPRCRQNYELLEQLDNELSPLAVSSFYSIASHHISLFNNNIFILIKTLVTLKNLSNSLSPNDDSTVALSLPILIMLTDINIFKYIESEMPFVLQYLLKRITSIAKRHKKDFKKFISSVDLATRTELLKSIRKFIMLNNYRNSGVKSYCLKAESSFFNFLKKPHNGIAISEMENSEIRLSSTSVGVETCVEGFSDRDKSEASTSTPHSVASTLTESCPYSKVMNRLRQTIYPLPLSDEERLIIQRNKILDLQKLNVEPTKKAPINFNRGSYLKTMEPHGCHSNCSLLLYLLQKSYSSKDYVTLSKYADICLSVGCSACLFHRNIVPLVGYICIQTNNVRLMNKAFHLYPFHPLLQKTFLYFHSKIGV